MKKSDIQYNFSSDVFKSEIEEIVKRRKNARGEGSEANPIRESFTVKNGFLGLAFSGGGIRSASFCLGVVQFLIKEGHFKKADYLSTVSGGGYTGSCISALLSENSGDETLLTERAGDAEPPALNRIRNHSEYLRVGGLFGGLRIPVLFAEGMARSFLTFLPFIIFLVFLTEVFFEFSGHLSAGLQWATPLSGALPLIVALILRPILKDKNNWQGRDKADWLFTSLTAIAVLSALSIPLLALLNLIVEHDASTLLAYITNVVSEHRLYAAIIGGVILLVLFIGLIKQGANMIVPFAGIVAPLALILTYTVFCVDAINTPYLHDDLTEGSGNTIELLQIESSEEGEFPRALSPELHRRLAEMLLSKQIKLEKYTASLTAPNTMLLLWKNKNYESSWFVRYLTTQDRRELNISTIQELDTDNHMLYVEELRLSGGNAEWWLYLAAILLQVYNWRFININRFSLHPFYRDRLSKTFLFRRESESDKLTHVDELKMSKLNGDLSGAPYHIINTALNLQGSLDPQLRSRKTVPFILSKRFCGSDYTGYCVTEKMENLDSSFNLGTAMAISAAAASPNMGTQSKKNLSFLLTLLNIRLNYWLPNPQRVSANNPIKLFMFKSLGLSYLLREALAKVDAKTPFINCSDGGHIENLAVYELLRRQCKTIICVDAEADPNFTFQGLTTLQRYAEIDLGTKIEIDLSGIKPVDGISNTNYTVGNIIYNNGETGIFLYLKLSFTGKEAEYLHYYRAQHPAYPHESTADQFFEETQFEVYRALGNFVARCAKDDIARILSGGH